MHAIKIAALAALALGFSGAAGAAAKDWKTVVIGMEGAYEPYNLTDPSGKIVGFEPDLAMDVCAREGGVQDHRPGLGRHDSRASKPASSTSSWTACRSPTSARRRSTSRNPTRCRRALSRAKGQPLAKAAGRRHARSTRQGRRGRRRRDQMSGRRFKGKTLGVQVSTTHANFAHQVFQGRRDVKEYKTTDERDLDLKSRPHRRRARRLSR